MLILTNKKKCMFARLLAIPLLLTVAILALLTWKVDFSFSGYIIIPVLLGAALFVFSPQINWWWYVKHPPDLTPGLRTMIERAPGLYQRLNAADQLKFRQRVSLFMMAQQFLPQGVEKVSPDVEAAVAASAVTLTMGKKEFLFPKYENVVLYQHPFPSPQYPEHFHVSEVYDEDGVLLFSIQHLMLGMLQPIQYLHIGLYEYAKVFMRSYPFARYPQIEEAHWPMLERISGFSRPAVEEYLNVPDISLPALATVYYFTVPDAFSSEWPEVFEQFRTVYQG